MTIKKKRHMISIPESIIFDAGISNHSLMVYARIAGMYESGMWIEMDKGELIKSLGLPVKSNTYTHLDLLVAKGYLEKSKFRGDSKKRGPKPHLYRIPEEEIQ